MENKLLEVCADIFDISVDKLTLETCKDDIEEWDSLALLRLLAEIEETFNCEIPIGDINKITVIREFLPYITK